MIFGTRERVPRRKDAAERKWALPTVAKGLGDRVPIKKENWI